MKKFIVIMLFAICLGGGLGAQSGIRFAEATWQELLSQAEKERKLIFMDAYTTWCGPCKMMSRNVFTDSLVGEFFNRHFINAKMDMEKGEGIVLSNQLGVMAYPTLLFVDADGEVVHRAVGYHSSDLLIQLGEAALDPDRNIGSILRRYEQGDRSPELLRNLALAKFEAMDGSYVAVAEEYLDTQEDWRADDIPAFIMRMADDLDSEMGRYMLNNLAMFETEFGTEAVMDKVNELIEQTIAHAGTEDGLRPVEQLYNILFPEQADRMKARLKMGFYAQREDWPAFARAASLYYERYPAESWEELNELAWVFYEEVDDRQALQEALGWARRSVGMERNYFNMDTLASLYFKLGKKKEAKKAAKAAIRIAREAGEDYSGTAELLERIKGK
ncbi:MAG: hypothetical protein RLY31_2285 [Bacteroidota bacterium]|jgi:thiol-disulfide isomerase/thioredoxin